MTSKIDPRAVDRNHNGIQVKRKELTKTFFDDFKLKNNNFGLLICIMSRTTDSLLGNYQLIHKNTRCHSTLT